jgi:hypothetical protein
VSPCYRKSATVECEGTVHHLIALFSTVAGKATFARRGLREIFNEINNLERLLNLRCSKKPF